MDKTSFKDKSIEWLEGYLSACYNYAVWHDSEMYLGYGITKYKEIKELILGIIDAKEKELRG